MRGGQVFSTTRFLFLANINPAVMDALWLLALLILVPVILFLGMDSPLNLQISQLTITVYLALSSCLGDSFRGQVSGFSINPRNATFDRHYFRTMTNSGPCLSEQIEMENIFKADPDLDSDEEL